MDAKGFMVVQAVLVSVSLTLVGLTAHRVLTLALAGGLLAGWLVLRARYRRGLECKPQPDEYRTSRDTIVTRQVIGAIVPPIAVATVMLASHTVVWDDKAVGVGIVAIASLWLALYASSLFDWYYVLARRDGVVCVPPCHGDRDWTGLTRTWYTSRALSGIAGALAVVVATTAFVFAGLNGPQLRQVDKVGPVLLAAAGTGLVLMRLLYGNLTTIGTVVSTCCLSPPDIRLGDRLTGPDGFLEGYVRDVSLEGITVVRLAKDKCELLNGTRRLKRHGVAEVIDKSDIEGIPISPCASGCRGINPNCLWGGRKPGEADAAEPPRPPEPGGHTLT